MRKPQIILFLPSLKSGGAQQQCLFMVNGLSDLYKFILIYDEEGPLYQNFYNSDIKLIKLNVSKSNYLFIRGIKYLARLNKIIKEIKPAIIYSWMQKANISIFLLKVFSVNKTNFKHISSIRFGKVPNPIDIRTWFEYKLLGVSYQQADLIIANSFCGKKNTMKTYNLNSRKIKIINNYIIFPEENKKNGSINDSIINIGFVGRLDKIKNPIGIIDAIAYLSKDKFRIRYFGHEESITKSQINDYALSKSINVEFFDYESSKAKIFSSIDLLVSPSMFEGSSNVILEAFSYGLPVVATDVGDNKIYCSNDRGSLVPINNNKRMSEMIIYEINNDSKKKKKSRTKYVNNNFSKGKMINSYIYYFNSCFN